ncbi:hypothetical protein OG762_51660 (plasmid) [Streptomyces sp. NBC_01136]|uniref:hypothetical protein n=1 Tax=Streptomyces sp. NBC_01136 TaxID=2903754 RepID=UPI002F911B48|nr:hypothetical protein OG762_51660 [Streptomyces sp. NBC_01136]
MAESQETACKWTAFVAPDDATVAELRFAENSAMRFAACGIQWDAVVIAPLERGLAALDALDLPQDEGHPVFADYYKQELIVQVRAGTAVDQFEDVQGVRPLSRGGWLMVPAKGVGTPYAAWISRPTRFGVRYVDAARLREALLTADRHGAPARC